jgi:glycerol-3-phosphate dehydrogenase subunit B
MMTMAIPEQLKCDLMVIGAGVAGMAAAGFAAARGVEAVQVGMTGEIIYASGLLDLLGVYPVGAKQAWANPWAAIAALRKDQPDHPYSRIKPQEIKAALKEFMGRLKEADLPYCVKADQNSEVLTPAGTLKLTYGVPASMWPGTKAWKNKWPCLLIDFKRLKGFSARQIVEVLKDRWPGLRCGQIEWPELHGELYAERLAHQLQLPQYRKRLAQILKPMIVGQQAVGLPAVLGIQNSTAIMADLAKTIGCPVFEIPTLPPAVTGIRVREALVAWLSDQGVRSFYQMKVRKARLAKSGGFILDIGRSDVELTVKAKAVVLASGRFIGQGLAADRTKIRETIFGLTVHQPASRNEWHQLDFLDPHGHAINRCGIEIDNRFRPIDEHGRIVHPRLFAAGSILAHADWMRMKCGSGLSIATAFAAIKAYLNQNSPTTLS